MSSHPKTCIVDTNVPIVSNLATDPDKIPPELVECVIACVEAISHVVDKGRLVVDMGEEILGEYRRHLSMRGQPGVGDLFMKWAHDNSWGTRVDRVSITRNGTSYNEFPDCDGLKDFDSSDRKFIAVANGHPRKPPILQAVDSKWWWWKEALAEVGITVTFLSPEYAKAKYEEKMCSE